jgi:RHS repeat-associated protein
MEPETGLVYLRARWYDPTTGRFLRMDDLEGDVNKPETLNKYAFAWNDPVNKVDPSGFEPQWGARITELFANFTGAPTVFSWLVYTGTELVWYQKGLLANQELYPRYTFRATSGYNHGGSNFQDVRYQDGGGNGSPGPVPTGNYKINLAFNGTAQRGWDYSYQPPAPALVGCTGIQNIPANGPFGGYPYVGWQEAWGKQRARLEPANTNQMFGRGGFYIHDSAKGYTHGCIETESAIFPLLFNYMRFHDHINVLVRYSGTSTFGGCGGLN